jgi:hypothetical protein
LELRSFPFVLLAYLAAPLVALSVYSVTLIAPAILAPNFSATQALGIWLLVVLYGSAFALVVEVVIVTPLLLAWRHFRWAWLNGWSGGLIGFLTAAVPFLMFEGRPPSPGEGSSAGGIDFVVDGHRTLAGWQHVVTDAFSIGCVGIAAAIVFRFVAVRSAKRDLGAEAGA